MWLLEIHVKLLSYRCYELHYLSQEATFINATQKIKIRNCHFYDYIILYFEIPYRLIMKSQRKIKST